MPGFAGAGNCTMCKSANRKEYEFRIVMGHSYQTVASLLDCSAVAVRNHFANGHYEFDVFEFREWIIVNGGGTPEKQLEARRQSFLEKLMAQPEEVNQQMINATLLLCANEAHELLQEMKDREDFRGSIAACESLRRAAMDISTLNALKSDGKKEDTYESADVLSLRLQIEEAYNKKNRR